MSRNWVPQAGDLIFIDFDPQAGREQAGTRPALVLSHAAYNAKAGLAIVCPITNQAKGYPFEVPMPEGQKITGVVLADQVKCVDWRVRRARRVQTAPRPVIDTVRQYIGLILGMKQGSS